MCFMECPKIKRKKRPREWEHNAYGREMMDSAKNCKGSKISPCLQANKLACPGCLDTAKDRRLLGQKRESFITHSNNNSHIIIIPQTLSSHRAMRMGPGDTCTHSIWNGVKVERGAQGTRISHSTASLPARCHPGRCRLCLPRMFAAQTSLKTVQHRGSCGTIAET